jgi:hypothetical protein
MPFIPPDSNDRTVYFRLVQDSTGTVGEPKTGLVFDSAGASAYYTRPLAAAAPISLVTQTVTGAHTDGGFVEVSAANAPGVYRLDLPDDVAAVGVDFALVTLSFTGVISETMEIPLVSSKAQVAGAIWDEAASSHVTNGTFGSALGFQVISTGVAQDGDTTTITLAAGEPDVDDIFNGTTIRIKGGTGVGQAAMITNYIGSSRVATVVPFAETAGGWAVQPDVSSQYVIYATALPQSYLMPDSVNNTSVEGVLDANVELWDGNPVKPDHDGYILTNVLQNGTMQAGSTSITAKLAAGHVITSGDFINGVLFITGGTGVKQVARILNSTQGTDVVDIEPAWLITPDVTSTYAIIVDAPSQLLVGAVLDVADQIWDEEQAGHTDPLTFGRFLDAQISFLLPDTVPNLIAAELTNIADAILKRDWTAVSGEAERSILNALRMLRNRVELNRLGGTYTVYEEDDSTPAYTGVLTTETGAAISSMDPT